MPGYTLTVAMNELAAGHYSSGTARLGGVLATLFLLACGAAIGHAGADALLPSWYMPGGIPSARNRPRWLKVLIVVLIVAFLVVDAYGLCSTYGDITIA